MKKLTSLSLAAAALLIALVLPPVPFPTKTYDFLFVIDITASMNVLDYQKADGSAISRLERSKQAMLSAVRALPCGSRVGIGVFTERTPALLYSPIEVCTDYPVLEASINQLDWRMAWVADSNIDKALYKTLETMQLPLLEEVKLVFFTDGHESPPINARYAEDYSYLEHEKLGEHWHAGMIVGTGMPGLSRIPKYDEEGKQVGFYQAEDVPHRTEFGLPEDPSKIEGYVPRNGPWGNQQVVGTEHLSNVRAVYLQSLAEKASMTYHHLQTDKSFIAALKQASFAEQHIKPSHLNVYFALLGLIFLVYCYHPFRPKWPQQP